MYQHCKIQLSSSSSIMLHNISIGCWPVQETPAHVTATHLAPGQAGKMQQHTPVAASAARQQSQMISQGAVSLQVASSTGHQTHTAQAARTATPAATVSALNQRLSSSPVLLDIQTSVSPMIPSISQPSPQGTSPVLVLAGTGTSSPVALAPTVAQPEAPTPTLLPRGSSSRPIQQVDSPAEASPVVSLPQSSPRNILSSLQQMNLQSKPFNFAADAQPPVEPLLAAAADNIQPSACLSVPLTAGP